MSDPIERPPLVTVAVIGNGIMGHGIAQVFAMAGKHVRLIGRSEASLVQARARIRTSLDDFVRHDIITAAEADAASARIATSVTLADAAVAELVIEAVTEDVQLKRKLFAELDRLCAASVVLASSSGQPASALNHDVIRKQRLIATHFWYPPQLIPLVEVCAGPFGDSGVLAWTCAALAEAGKQPVVIDREIPGFIGNRLQFAMLREAWSLWASGAASAEAIDTVVRNTVGRRLGITGPLESADLGGIETMYQFAASLQPELDRSPRPPQAIADLAAQAPADRTIRRGVHDWARRDDAALLRARTEELFRWLA
ncbi:MAG TPA: 3-hydroxyacyl-CoA dehydrogenase family protein, partial [Acetobacteraceae bacterium]|nr:3-hydroxyacyl-CoA dehydrogenase family protein [Acetobacteraceae bacterium]